MITINPCLKCGGKTLRTKKCFDRHEPNFTYSCKECNPMCIRSGTTGVIGHTEDEALDNWNKTNPLGGNK